MRTGSFVAALALLAPVAASPALSQTASADWEAVYRLVLAREWAAAAPALDRFAEQFPAHDAAEQARFWRCYADEQLDRHAAASACYDALVERGSDPQSRWQREARARRVVVNARLRAAGTAPSPASGAWGGATVVQDGKGQRRALVVRQNADGTVDTLRLTGQDAEAALAVWDDARHARARALEGRAEALEAVRAAQDAVRAQGVQLPRVCVGDDCPAVPAPPAAPAPPASPRWGQTCTEGDCSGYSYAYATAERDTLTDEERVAVLAVEALGRQGNAAAVPDLRGLVAEGRSVPVRLAAVQALARIGTPEATAAVVEGARRFEGLSSGQYVEVVNALARLGSRAPQTPGLAEALERIGRLRGVRAGAIQALSRVRSDEATRALWRIAEDASLPAEKGAAALGYLVERGSGPDVSRAVARLEALVRASDGDGARAAAQALVSAVREAGEELDRLERLAADASLAASLRVVFVQALGRFDTPRTVALLGRLARDGDRRLSQSAVQALGRIDSPEARQALVDLARGR